MVIQPSLPQNFKVFPSGSGEENIQPKNSLKGRDFLTNKTKQKTLMYLYKSIPIPEIGDLCFIIYIFK